MEAAKKAKQVQQVLVHEQQIDAVKKIYQRSVDIKLFGLSFPSLSHLKKQLVACAETLSPGLSEQKLHREICIRYARGSSSPCPKGATRTRRCARRFWAFIFARWTS
jgi:hypothetical protein